MAREDIEYDDRVNAYRDALKEAEVTRAENDYRLKRDAKFEMAKELKKEEINSLIDAGKGDAIIRMLQTYDEYSHIYEHEEYNDVAKFALTKIRGYQVPNSKEGFLYYVKTLKLQEDYIKRMSDKHELLTNLFSNLVEKAVKAKVFYVDGNADSLTHEERISLNLLDELSREQKLQRDELEAELAKLKKKRRNWLITAVVAGLLTVLLLYVAGEDGTDGSALVMLVFAVLTVISGLRASNMGDKAKKIETKLNPDKKEED